MPFSCHDCSHDIICPWDGELATFEDVHTCERCKNPVCWDCKNMDTTGNDYCESCADEREDENPDAFKH